MIKKEIFREYDIRGIYKEELDEETAYLFGRAFGSNLRRLGKDRTIVGYDNRSSSNSIEQELVKGITESGVDVIRIGLTTTPMFYYAWDLLKISSGVMVTASHNPKEYNGFKFSYNGIHNAYGESVKEVYNIIINRDFINGNGVITTRNIKEEYIKLITEGIRLGNRKLKVVYDCGNGTTSIIAKDIFNKIDVESIPMYDISDPNFPNHHPDPLVEENLKDLKAKVLETKSDLGVSFDGDGDRVGIIDENGVMIDIDKFMIIIWRDIYNKVSPKKGLFDVKCSKALEDELIKLGIEPVCYRTGNSYLKAMSVEGDFPFSGELSGHIFFRDRFPGYDDGIYASLRLIEILSKTGKKVSELLDGINKYYSTKEIKVEVAEENKNNVINKVKTYCESKDYKILTIDGIKVLFDDGFALIRKSNTGPHITARYEAKNELRLKDIQTEFNIDRFIK